MLIPAVLKKEEIHSKFKKFYYTDDMLLYTGCLNNSLPSIIDEPDDGLQQFAIVDDVDKLIGFITYRINWYNSSAYCFGLFSFDRGNKLIGLALKETIEKLLNVYKLHRVEWRMVGGNPVERHYDTICRIYNGSKLVLHDVIKDSKGEYHDDIIYEIINKEAGLKKSEAADSDEKVSHNKIICPYCGFEHEYYDYLNPTDMDGDFTMKCEHCDESFKVTFDTDVSFVSKKIDAYEEVRL